MEMRYASLMTAALLLTGLSAPEAMAQGRYRTPTNVAEASQTRDCTVKKGPGGLIRGDQIPSGCVIHEDNRADLRPMTRFEDGMLPTGVAIYHTPGPVKVILSDATLAGITTAGPPQFGGQLAQLPRDQAEFEPARRFGPIERNFGSRRRNFGRDPGSGLTGNH